MRQKMLGRVERLLIRGADDHGVIKHSMSFCFLDETILSSPGSRSDVFASQS
jgi:hypothetical protein